MHRREGAGTGWRIIGILAAVAGDEEHEGVDFRPPPPPDDRLWRHPSELAIPPRRSWAERHALGVAAFAALGGALVTSAVWLLFSGSTTSTIRVREQVAMPPVIAMQPKYVSMENWSNEVSSRSASAVFPIESSRGETTSTGVAIAVVDNGYLIAPAHLVSSDAVVSVITDGARLPAQVVGVEPINDIAVLHVDVRLPIAVTSRSVCPEVKQHLLLIGASANAHPLLPASVVAVDQRVGGAPGQQLFFRIDASVEVAFDGGAIVDDTGAIVGIATIPPGATTKDGYAIPISVGRAIMWDLINSGESANMAIGIDGRSVTGLSGSHDSGVFVSDVVAESPAARAGLREDDIIVAVDGHAVSTMTALSVFGHDRSDGSPIMLDVLRDGRVTKVGVSK